MAERMLQFVHLPQQSPDKRPVAIRREDFDEIYRRLRSGPRGRPVQPLQPVRHALLLDPLPARATTSPTG